MVKLLDLLKKTRELLPKEVLPPLVLPPLDTSRWVHLSEENNYKLIVPPASLDPEQGEPALMCTVIKNEISGEVRLIPYYNVPLKLIANQELGVTTRKLRIEKGFCADLEEN